MPKRFCADEAAQKAHTMIFTWQKLLIAAQRAKACGCDVIVDEEKGIFYPDNPNFHGEITVLCGDAAQTTLNSK